MCLDANRSLHFRNLKEAEHGQPIASLPLLPRLQRLDLAQVMNECILSACENTMVVFVGMFMPPSEMQTDMEYIGHLKVLSQELPPTLFIQGVDVLMTDQGI